MEEYQTKVNYLRHIKNIADIQDGHRKPNALTTIFSQSHTSIIKAIQKSIKKGFHLQNTHRANVQFNLKHIQVHKE
jgi:hypothetical protein